MTVSKRNGRFAIVGFSLVCRTYYFWREWSGTSCMTRVFRWGRPRGFAVATQTRIPRDPRNSGPGAAESAPRPMIEKDPAGALRPVGDFRGRTFAKSGFISQLVGGSRCQAPIKCNHHEIVRVVRRTRGCGGPDRGNGSDVFSQQTRRQSVWTGLAVPEHEWLGNACRGRSVPT